MAYPIADKSIIEIAIEGTCEGQQFISLFHYMLKEAGGAASGAAIVDALLADVMGAGGLFPPYLACLPDEVIDVEVYGQVITMQRYRYRIAPGGPFVGQTVGIALPPNVAAAITKFGDVANRHGVGTVHMPAVPTTFQANGSLAAPGLAAYQALADTLATPFVTPTGGDLIPVLFNRVAPQDSVPIVGAFVQPTVRVARRRTVGLGS